MTYLQDVVNVDYNELISNMVLEKPYTLIDKRDDKKYGVVKLKDGSVLMDNLRLVGKTISSDDSDMTEGTFIVPNEQAIAFKTVDTDVEANHAYLDNERGEEYGAFYTYYCATAGSGNKSLTTNGQKAPNSIAPKGWRMITEEDVKSIRSAYDVDNNADGAAKMTSAPLNFKYGAYVWYGGELMDKYYGSEGLIWYPTISNNLRAKQLDIVKDNFVYDKDNPRCFGFSVRCILKKPS